MPLSPVDRQRLGLDLGDEYGGAQLPAPGAPVPYVPNLRLLLKPDEKASAPKIRQMVNELLAGNMDNANQWLQQVAAGSPKIALELYIELAKFSLPQLKAVAVQVDDRTDSPRSLSIAQLQQALQGD